MPALRHARESRLRNIAIAATVLPIAAIGALMVPSVAQAHSRSNCASVTSSVPVEATTKVNNLRVNWCVKDAVQRMVDDAAGSGIALKGGGWRDTKNQIELRKAHCGGDDHNSIWVKRASQCSPATAIPGKSQHERGLALDFAKNGRSITSKSPEFAWLKAHAADYGFYNLPSEPWHWSVTGG